MRKVEKGPNFYLALLISIISVGAVLLAITSSNSVKTMKSGTPEAVVQAYIQNVNEGRTEEAAANFTEDSNRGKKNTQGTPEQVRQMDGLCKGSEQKI